MQNHLDRFLILEPDPITEEKGGMTRRRKLGRLAKTSVDGIIIGLELLACVLE
jgi:hypothetical protein